MFGFVSVLATLMRSPDILLLPWDVSVFLLLTSPLLMSSLHWLCERSVAQLVNVSAGLCDGLALFMRSTLSSCAMTSLGSISVRLELIEPLLEFSTVTGDERELSSNGGDDGASTNNGFC